jgi:hypothetical protein
MFPVCRHMDTKKPATLMGRGLAASTKTASNSTAMQTGMALLQLHSVFVRGRLLLGQAMDIAAAQ